MRELNGPARYGRYYWCIKSPLSESGEIYVHADRIETTGNGALICWGGGGDRDENPEHRHPVMVIAPGKWSVVYAASLMDGSAIAVEHWEGEVVR